MKTLLPRSLRRLLTICFHFLIFPNLLMLLLDSIHLPSHRKEIAPLVFETTDVELTISLYKVFKTALFRDESHSCLFDFRRSAHTHHYVKILRSIRNQLSFFQGHSLYHFSTHHSSALISFVHPPSPRSPPSPFLYPYSLIVY